MKEKEFTIHGGHFHTSAPLIVILGNAEDKDGDILHSYGLRSEETSRQYRECAAKFDGNLEGEAILLDLAAEATNPESEWNGPTHLGICFMLGGYDDKKRHVFQPRAIYRSLASLYNSIPQDGKTGYARWRPFFYMDISNTVGLEAQTLYQKIKDIYSMSNMSGNWDPNPEVSIRVSDEQLTEINKAREEYENAQKHGADEPEDHFTETGLYAKLTASAAKVSKEAAKLVTIISLPNSPGEATKEKSVAALRRYYTDLLAWAAIAGLQPDPAAVEKKIKSFEKKSSIKRKKGEDHA